MLAISDTHAFLWHLLDEQRLSPMASGMFEHAANLRNPIGVATITIVEIIYLVNKGRYDPAVLSMVQTVLGDRAGIFRVVFLTADIAYAMQQVSRDQVPDMPDRIIAATALALGLPLITRDRKIVASNVTTVW